MCIHTATFEIPHKSNTAVAYIAVLEAAILIGFFEVLLNQVCI